MKKSKIKSQELKEGAELEEQSLSGLCLRIMHTKYLVDKKAAWRLVSNSVPFEIEQIINYTFVMLTKNTVFKNWKSFYILFICQIVWQGKVDLAKQARGVFFEKLLEYHKGMDKLSIQSCIIKQHKIFYS